jgi:EF-P beta-lysylation protein EpmB
MKQAFRRASDLLEHLALDADDLPYLDDPDFPILAPRPYVDRIRRGDPADPLLRQILPDPRERDSAPGFSDDPVGDQASSVGRGLLHKYQGRLLLVSTGACAIHCRYCFRQAYPYAQDHFQPKRIAQLVAYLDAHPDIEEIILSGGDPLMLDTSRLRELSNALRDRAQIQRLRLHTRLPVVLPSRIDEGLLDWLDSLPWQTVVVIHANHAQEFDGEVDSGLARLRAAGATLLNQAVLMAEVNDSARELSRLMRRGFEAGVLPYYLHLLDRVSGAARFEVGQAQALALIEQLRIELPGYLVPRLVKEQAGAPYKLPVL